MSLAITTLAFGGGGCFFLVLYVGDESKRWEEKRRSDKRSKIKEESRALIFIGHLVYALLPRHLLNYAILCLVRLSYNQFLV